jgi:hypothetical protein
MSGDTPRGTRRITGEEAARMLLPTELLQKLEAIYRGATRTDKPADWSQVIKREDEP